MKISAFILLLFMPLMGFAQNYPGMGNMDMQKIQEMQACMEKIDQSQMQALEKRQQQFDAEVSSLCESGKRDAAQEKALSYVQEIMNNPTIKALKKCGEIAKGMMPEMSFMDQEEMDSGQHVCDSY